MLMQTDVKAVAESAVDGTCEAGRTRKLGTVDWNQGVGEQRVESHWPVAVSASLVRERTSVSERKISGDLGEVMEIGRGFGSKVMRGRCRA